MFNIVNRAGAIEQHQMQKEVAKPVARGILENRIKTEMTKATDPWWQARVDAGDALKNAKQAKKDYDRTRPETLLPGAKNAMWKRAKLLKDTFVVGMLSREELHPVKTLEANGKIVVVVDEERMASLGSVERERAWQKRNASHISEYKKIMRHLNPDNSRAGDVEKFRPKRRDR